MTTTTETHVPDGLAWIGKRAADYLATRGWVQHRLRSETGAACQTGALRAVAESPGDWLLAGAVVRARGQGEVWNDQPNRTHAEVETALRDSGPITTAELTATFGPQWAELCELVRRAAVLAPGEAERLRAGTDTAHEVLNHLAGLARAAAGETTGGPSWAAAQLSCHATSISTRLTPITTVTTAAIACSTRHAVGRDGYTRSDYDRLTHPWRATIGPLHPDDPAEASTPTLW
jgi:hypothetical protein